MASKGGVGVEGAHLWDLKDRIDRVWMDGYGALLPSMEEMEARREEQEATSSSTAVAVAPKRSISETLGREAIDMLSKAKMRCALLL